jgi:hypothetical protein
MPSERTNEEHEMAGLAGSLDRRVNDTVGGKQLIANRLFIQH